METIPAPGQRLRIGDYSLEVLQVTDNAVKTVRLTQPAVAKLDKPA